MFPFAQNLMTQCWLNGISEWTKKQKMKINGNKTKCMVFNFSKKYQFSPRFEIDGDKIEVIDSTQLLGTIITSDGKKTPTILLRNQIQEWSFSGGWLVLGQM